MPSSTAERRCPRCGGAFVCGAASGQCDCMGLRLSPGQRVQLAQRYPGQCLCLRCLREMSLTEPSACADANLRP